MTILKMPSVARNNALTSIKGILALLVFLGHLLPTVGCDALGGVGGHCVLFFFVISGYTLSMSYGRRLYCGEVSYSEFISRRLSRIFPIHWVILLLYILFSVGNRVLWALPLHVLLLQAFVPFQFWDYNGTAWFLSVMLFNYMMFPLYNKAIKLDLRKSILTWLTLLATIVGLYYLIPEQYGRVWLFYINPFVRTIDFMLGMIVYEVASSLKEKSCTMRPYFGEGFTLAVVIVYYIFVRHLDVSAPWPLYYIPVVLIVYEFGLCSRGFVNRILQNKVLRFSGEVSLAVYMLHRLMIHLGEKYALRQSVSDPAYVITTLIVTYFFAWLMTSYVLPSIEKQSQKVFNRILSIF